SPVGSINNGGDGTALNEPHRCGVHSLPFTGRGRCEYFDVRAGRESRGEPKAPPRDRVDAVLVLRRILLVQATTNSVDASVGVSEYQPPPFGEPDSPGNLLGLAAASRRY